MPDINPTTEIPPVPPPRAKSPWMLIGIVAGLIALAALGTATYYSVRAQNGNPPKTMQDVSHYSEAELGALYEGTPEQRQTATDYIIAHPDAVAPIWYAFVSSTLWERGDRAQAAFWYSLFEIRTSPWIAKDPDPSSLPALRSAFKYQLGSFVNPWIASDVHAWHAQVVRVIAYEKHAPLYPEKPSYLSEEEWKELVASERASWEQQFTDAFDEWLADDGKAFEEQRKQNGLSVGPWEDPGAPLPEDWR